MKRPACCPALALVLVLVTSGTTHADFASGMAAYERGEFAEALREWQPLAEGGLVEAQFNLGLLHHHGKGVPRDSEQAFSWYLKAAEAGYARARYRVAEMLEAGDGVRRDLVRAHFWFRMAGEQRFADARKRRKRVAKSLTPEQIAYADMLARHRLREEKAARTGKPVSR